jgi:hypothetical protein
MIFSEDPETVMRARERAMDMAITLAISNQTIAF